MSDGKISDFRFSGEEIRRVLGSPEGKRLLGLLTKDGGALLHQAADALRSGQQDTAKQLLSPLMETKEAEELVRKLNRE